MKNIILIISSIIRPIISLQQITPQINPLINQKICINCKYCLFIGEDGFLTCSNNKCGIIYKDNLDTSAEWRYYGNDDNNHNIIIIMYNDRQEYALLISVLFLPII